MQAVTPTTVIEIIIEQAAKVIGGGGAWRETKTGAQTVTIITLNMTIIMIAIAVFYPNPNAKPFLIGILSISLL